MGACWLLHSLRLAAPKKSRWRGATFVTIRSTFVKIAVRDDWQIESWTARGTAEECRADFAGCALSSKLSRPPTSGP